MELTSEQIATNWITYARYEDPFAAPDEISERGELIYNCAEDRPTLAWGAIISTISRYDERDLFSEEITEAKKIIGNTAAGPLEDLLAKHGAEFIEKVEAEAVRDRRFFWALGCVWKNAMTEEVWARVQIAGGNISR